MSKPTAAERARAQEIWATERAAGAARKVAKGIYTAEQAKEHYRSFVDNMARASADFRAWSLSMAAVDAARTVACRSHVVPQHGPAAALMVLQGGLA